MAWVMWALLVIVDAAIRFSIILIAPFIALKSGFGVAHTQMTAQANVTFTHFMTRPWPRVPRADWRRLLGLRHRRAPKRPPSTIQHFTRGDV